MFARGVVVTGAEGCSQSLRCQRPEVSVSAVVLAGRVVAASSAALTVECLVDEPELPIAVGSCAKGSVQSASLRVLTGLPLLLRGPVLASAFSNRGCDNIAGQMHALGVRVLRMGLCPEKEPYSLETRLQEIGKKKSDRGLGMAGTA
ncbi:unnamed protein product [Prorocentrum cordatum]|uniref:Uncharacterized protein n=1 Tax=Prorocentrum cordatum TaxID=2364126 RepID=A0ABN9V6C1_9DINO|nr:unnamed protein product [Polarella glacialis]